jgi:hypothetical protein
VPALSDFLLRNNIPIADAMPLVHTTSSYTMTTILKNKIIKPSICEIFTPGRLAYFFAGRPSYKMDFDHEGEYWQLPSCIIVDYKSIAIKRLYPFDSGAFHKKKLPDYLTMMSLDEFDLKPAIDSAQKLIGAFFVKPSQYFRMQPRTKADFERRFHVETLDQEVRALYNVILSKSAKYDDRRFAIEAQTEQPTLLDKKNVLGVVFPEFMKWVEQDLDAEPLPYQTFPLNPEYYYHAIYEKIFSIYQSKGYFK